MNSTGGALELPNANFPPIQYSLCKLGTTVMLLPRNFTIEINDNGSENKNFNVDDGLGVSLAKLETN